MRIAAFFVIFIGCFGVSVLGNCPRHWRRFGGYCYAFITRPTTFCEAMIRCQLIGGYLAEPRNHCENHFVSSLAKKRRSWIGLNDIVTENKFRWNSNGQHLGKFNSWGVREPNNYKNQEDCTETNFGIFAKWNDISCNARFPFVCQRKH